MRPQLRPQKPIVSSNNPICLVGAAPIANFALWASLPQISGFVAVDGGADRLLQAAVAPLAVIGDLDSLSDAARSRFADKLHHIAEQDTTDFEKAIMRIAAPLILAIGFTGGRLDHTLAVLNVMARYDHCAIVLCDQHDVSFLVPQGGCVIDVPGGTRVSLMPLAPLRVTAKGLRWPVRDMAMALAGQTGPSNESNGGPVTIDCDGPLLVTLPRAVLPAAMQAAARAR